MKNIIKKLRKGFTIVELIVVIAVIAVLAAVLIPTFANLIDSANESNDISMIYNVNQALSIEKNDIKTVSDALDIAAEAGYNIDKLTPSSDGEIVYDHATKSFALISTEGEVIYPTSNSSLDLNAPTTYYFVDEATYTALNTATSASASSYSLAKASIKSATAEKTANTSTTAEHTVSYIAKGDWTGEFSYTGMGAIDTTRAKGITSVSYTSKTVTNDKNYKLNVAYYISESSADGYSLTVNITEIGDYTIYSSVVSGVDYKFNVDDSIDCTKCTFNIVEANEDAAQLTPNKKEVVSTITITINDSDVTSDYVNDQIDNIAIVENGILQLGTEKYPYLLDNESFIDLRGDTYFVYSNSYYGTEGGTIYFKFISNVTLEYNLDLSEVLCDMVFDLDGYTLSSVIFNDAGSSYYFNFGTNLKGNVTFLNGSFYTVDSNGELSDYATNYITFKYCSVTFRDCYFYQTGCTFGAAGNVDSVYYYNCNFSFSDKQHKLTSVCLLYIVNDVIFENCVMDVSTTYTIKVSAYTKVNKITLKNVKWYNTQSVFNDATAKSTGVIYCSNQSKFEDKVEVDGNCAFYHGATATKGTPVDVWGNEI